MKLTAKQRKFVHEYCLDLNRTQAVIRAGYSEKTACEQASRLLRNVKVSAAIQSEQARLAEEPKVDAEWILSKLGRIATTDILPEKVTAQLVERRQGDGFVMVVHVDATH